MRLLRNDATRVYSYERRAAADEGGTCREVRRAVGDQHLTVEGAKKAANDAWAGTVRFHLGEKFMDLHERPQHRLHVLALVDQARRRHNPWTVADPLRDRSNALPSSARGRGQQQGTLIRVA